jgi:predicted short-subunit dehydrogenase-like oxidoreductase (DUF2520 family)
MVHEVCVVGAGRVGSALAARLRQRGVHVRTSGREIVVGSAELVLLCVPDTAISDVARHIDLGPWVAHVSGATRLDALEPHRRRFSLHPLQTFSRERGPEQLDGAFAAVTAETPEGHERGFELARLLGLRPFELADEDRPLYHAGAVVASNYLVTLFRAASALLEEAGVPAEALEPLMRRTIENDFELTGPIERGDWETVQAHLATISDRVPELEQLYAVLAEATARVAGRTFEVPTT